MAQHLKNRVVMDVRVGEQVETSGPAIIRVVEKSGRNRARLIFEVDEHVKLSKKVTPLTKRDTDSKA